jgi:glycosyltransferase involved in cell wall biosynthesis
MSNQMKINSNPKVSVCVVAYNHERYIRDCLQSLVEQETNFTFEIIVGEDCSTDGTRLIIEEFAKNYPDLVRPIYHVKNVGAADNYYSVHAAAAGKYIAHLDGDDYALAGKLQMQADYLDTHPDCNIVWHRMKIEYEKTGELLDDLIDLSCFPSGGVVREDLLEFITFGLHSSKMYRAGLREFDKPNFQVLDFYINVMQIGNGRACLLGGAAFRGVSCGYWICLFRLNKQYFVMQDPALFFENI